MIRPGPVTAVLHPRLRDPKVRVGSVDRVPPGDRWITDRQQHGRRIVEAPEPQAKPGSLKLHRFHAAQRRTPSALLSFPGRHGTPRRS